MASKFSSEERKKKDVRKFYKFPKFWSYSRWNVANKCMRRYELQHLRKLEQHDSPAMARGSLIHKKGEDYLDSGGRMPKEYNLFKDEMKAIRKLGAIAEQTFAYTKTWGKTVYDDWQNCWLRIKIDAQLTDKKEATLVDFKTGRPYKDTKEQSELYAIGKFQDDKKVETVDAEFWYLDSGEVVDYFYSRDDFRDLKKLWTARGQELLAARQFPTTKNAYNCTYCPFRSDKEQPNGLKGPCEGWKKAK